VICVLQFDAAAVAVVERLLAEGRLPNLAALRDRGRLHQLETPATDFAAGAFHTLYSGVELGDHGLFYPFQWSAPEQRTRYATAFDAPPAVWERLGAAGLRTLAIDPYESRPPANANGVFVCGWGFCDRVVLPRWSRPAGAARGHLRRHGRGPEATEIFGRPRPAELLRLRRVLIEAPERIAALAEELLACERFDLAWLTFSAAHLAGHQFWDLSQVDERSVDPEARAALASALDDVYVAVDRAFGRVMAALPAGADVVVTSAVGMGVNTSRADLLPEMLAAVVAGGPIESEGAGAIWRLRAAMPAGLRGAIARAIPDRAALALTARLELRGIDWTNTPAFAHPADNQGYVRLNLRGRERGGVVAPEAAAGLMEEIAAGLATFEDADGASAVASVARPAELYRGRHAERLPDLVVRWSDRPAAGLTELRSERFGTVRRRGSGSGRSGNHTPGDAWALAAPGRATHVVPARPPRLIDVAATICELTGADPAGLPGEPLLVGPGTRCAAQDALTAPAAAGLGS
jgi:predicted AlkP superfamily phosphohydrolase/phosphomutase